MSDTPTTDDQPADGASSSTPRQGGTPDPSGEEHADHERRDGGSPANLLTHGRTGAALRDSPGTRAEAEDAGEGATAPATDGRTGDAGQR